MDFDWPLSTFCCGTIIFQKQRLDQFFRQINYELLLEECLCRIGQVSRSAVQRIDGLSNPRNGFDDVTRLVPKLLEMPLAGLGNPPLEVQPHA